jgi:hypothetical protein
VEDIEQALADQANDPGNDSGADAKVLAGLQQLKSIAAQVVTDQEADAPGSTDDNPTDADDPTTDDGDEPASADSVRFADIDPAAPCPAASDCGHPAGTHANTDSGDNSGPCSTPGCDCKGAVATTAAVPAPQATTDGVPAPANADPNALDADTNAPVAADPNEPDLAPGEVQGPAFTIPVGVIEGVETSDSRMIAPNALTWRTPPLPLTAQFETDEGHDGGRIVGRIDSVTRDGSTITAQGVFDTSPDGLEAARRVGASMFRGVSVDIVDATTTETVTELDPDGFPIGFSLLVESGVIAGWCITPIPAFEGCFIVLGDGTDASAPAEIPMTAAGRAPSMNLIDLTECAPCQAEAVTAAGTLAPPTEWFNDPELGDYTPITVTDEGQVFGHIAAWGVCHTGIPGRCQTAPHSRTNYAHFRTGRVMTSEGELVATGRLTMGAGHAGLHASPTETMAHYDNTATAVADVVAGEDEYGIWVAGAIRPGVTDEQVYALRASPISGDWRKVGASMELHAALCVNTPGFPIPASLAASGETLAMVATGAAIIEAHRPAPDPEPIAMTPMERALSPLLDLSADRLRDDMASI